MTQEPTGALTRQGFSERTCRLLAGMDTGIAGAIVVVGWFMFHSWLTGEFWWAKLNVAGGLFYGSSVYTMGFGRASLAGAALLLVVYSLLGALFGLIARPSGFTRNLLLGMLLAMTWHVFSQRYFWRRLDSFGLAYFPVLSTLPAHLIFGLSLSRYANRFQRLAVALGDSSWVLALLERLQPPPEETVENPPAPAESSTPEDQPATPPEPPGHDPADEPAPPASMEGSAPPHEAMPESSPDRPPDSVESHPAPSEAPPSPAPPGESKPLGNEESSPSVKSDC